MPKRELTNSEDQSRLSGAARCSKCKKIWATYSNRFCSVHSKVGWLVLVEKGKVLQTDQVLPIGVKTTAPNFIFQEEKTVALEEIRIELGLSREQLRLVLKMLNIVPRLNTGSARIRELDEIKLREEFKPVRHPQLKGPTASQPRPITKQVTKQVTRKASPTAKRGRTRFVLPSLKNCEMANFDSHEIENLTRADFSGYSFTGASFRNCVITNVRFDRMNLHKVRFTNSILKDCRFHRTDLSKAWFDSSTIEDCDFYGARLVDSTFRKAKIRAGFVQVYAVNADFGFAEFESCDFEEAKLENANFESADVQLASFTSADLKWANLSFAKLNQSQFSDEQIESSVAPQPNTNTLDRHHLKADGTPKKPLSEQSAELVLASHHSRGDRNASTYKCPSCGMWHIGH